LSAITPEIRQTCKGCSRDLQPGIRVCSLCHTLVHADELTRIKAEATALEEAGEFRLARDSWLKALELLPPEARQAEWVRKHAESLEVASQTSSPGVKTHDWARKFGPLAPIAIALAKGKALFAIFKFKFLLSFAAFLWFYAILYGGYFGIGFAALILIHEMGHFIDVKRRGLSADMPIFLPGFGAYVKWRALGVPAETRAFVSLAGPLAGWIASAACALIWWKTGAGIWAALARASVWLNVLNLIPIWILDGGQAIAAMNKAERISLVTIGAGLSLLLSEGIFFLVAGGACYRLFTHDFPPQPSRRVTAYYLGVLVLLAFVMWTLPAVPSGSGK
jgi:Zn-dependent protease